MHASLLFPLYVNAAALGSRLIEPVHFPKPEVSHHLATNMSHKITIHNFNCSMSKITMVSSNFVCRLHAVILLLTCAAAFTSLEEGWAVYRHLLVAKPLLTKSATSAVIMGVSDTMTQTLEKHFRAGGRKAGHDWKRTWYNVATGFCWSGLSAHVWYQQLEIICSFLPVSGRLQGLILRLLLDAAIFSPITIAGFFIVNTLVQGGSLRLIQEKLSSKWKRAVFAAWSFWPIVNIANFSFVPLPLRVLYSSIMALIWTGYLSYVNNQKKARHGPLID